jgi:heterodisulfide reductase subunit A-like polyferredoxin
VRYDDLHPLHISYQERIKIQALDLNLHQSILIQPELVILAMPTVPQGDVKSISTMFKAPIDEHGFFIEAHVKLRPVDFATDGLFMAGLAHYPKLLDESMIQAQAAAGRAARVLSKDSITAGGQVAVVDESRCTACLTCVRICPFGVPQIQVNRTGVGNILGAAFIEPSICQGCGSCASECPAQAIELKHYTDAQMMAKINGLIHPDLIVAREASIGG